MAKIPPQKLPLRTNPASYVVVKNSSKPKIKFEDGGENGSDEIPIENEENENNSLQDDQKESNEKNELSTSFSEDSSIDREDSTFSKSNFLRYSQEFSKDTPTKKGNLFQIKHHFGTDIAELLSGTGSPSLPRLIVFLCESILTQSSRSSPSSILGWISSPIPKETLAPIRNQLDQGNFQESYSPDILFSMLKTFFRELPMPMFPSHLYENCIGFVGESLKRAIVMLRKSRLYRLLLRKLGIEIDMNVEKMWQIALGDRMESDLVHDGSVVEEIRALQAVIKAYAFNLRTQLPELEELFFSLTKQYRDTLEYFGVFCAKLELDFCKNKGEEGVILPQLAGIFAPYLMRPSIWNTTSQKEKKKAKFLQQKFLLLFFLFLKKKHNLLTKMERVDLDRSDEEVMDHLIAIHLPGGTVAMLLSETMDLSSSPSSLINSELPSNLTSINNSPQKEFDIFPPHDSQYEKNLPPRYSKYKETLLDNLKFKPLILEIDENFATREFVDQKDSMKVSFQNYLVSNWDLTEQKEVSKEKFLLECPSFREWIDKPKLSITVPYIFHRIAEEIQQSLIKRKQKHQFPSKSNLESKVEDEPDYEQMIFEDGPPGRGILSLLKKGELKDDNIDPINLEESKVIPAANYDFAMTFPRTLAQVTSDQSTSSFQKSEDQSSSKYLYDVTPGLFNHNFPPKKDSPVCEICSLAFSVFTSRRKIMCRYCGRILCSTCCQRNFIIPSNIVQNGSFVPQLVCTDCENHLNRNLKSSMIELSYFSKTAISTIGKKKIQELVRLRGRLMRWIYYFILSPRQDPKNKEDETTICPSATELLSLISNQEAGLLQTSSFGSGPLLTLVDLLEIQTRRYFQRLEELEAFLQNHVLYCPSCSKQKHVCSARNYCNRLVDSSPPVIDGYDFKEVKLCKKCKLHCHSSCWLIDPEICLWCEVDSKLGPSTEILEKPEPKQKDVEKEEIEDDEQKEENEEIIDPS